MIPDEQLNNKPARCAGFSYPKETALYANFGSPTSRLLSKVMCQSRVLVMSITYQAVLITVALKSTLTEVSNGFVVKRPPNLLDGRKAGVVMGGKVVDSP